MNKNQKENSLDNTVIPFGAGLAIGSLVTGLLKAAWTVAVATGLGIAVYSLFPKNKKEQDACKYGQKQN